MKRITLTNEQYDLLLRSLDFSDANSVTNEGLARMFPEKASYYQEAEKLETSLKVALEAAETFTVESGANGELCRLHGDQYSIGCQGCEDAIATRNRLDALMP